MGHLFIDLKGYRLDEEEKELLKHPFVCGVILFSRNYQEIAELNHLIKEIRFHANKPLIISVDQEGGRVQRFKKEFTLLPPAAAYLKCSDNLSSAMSSAYDAGWVMASELAALDIDLSFAPVLDLGEDCPAIGDRSFSNEIESLKSLSYQFIRGMRLAGMSSTGKHFPGHGNVLQDSHFKTPVDQREYQQVYHQDMAIYAYLIDKNMLDAIMPAHIIYPDIDPDFPASLSPIWLKNILREQLSFRGIVFSDDLNMKGASIVGEYSERAMMALKAGCDMLLLCNNREATINVLDNVPLKKDPNQDSKIQRLLHRSTIDRVGLLSSIDWKEKSKKIMQLKDRWDNYLQNR